MDNEPREDASLAEIIRKLARGPLRGLLSRAEYCIHCGFCNSVCPTSSIPSAFRETRTSRGRAILFQTIVSQEGLESIDEDWVHGELNYCFNCGKCVIVCPVDVPIPMLVSVFRWYYRGETGKPRQMIDRVIVDYDKLSKVISMLPMLYNALVSSRRLKQLLRIIGLNHIAPLPRVVNPRIRVLASRGSGENNKRGSKSVLVLVDPYNWVHEPRVVRAVIRLVELLGFSVEVLGPRDHYMTALDLGHLDKVLRGGTELLRDLIKTNHPLILPISPAAFYMLKFVLPSLLGRPALEISRRVIDIYELLLSNASGIKNRSSFETSVPIIYHESCLSFSSGQSKRIVKALEFFGVRIAGKLHACCGIGGAWGLKAENLRPYLETSLKFLRTIPRTGVSLLVTESETCRLQIRHMARSIRVMHPCELLLSVIE